VAVGRSGAKWLSGPESSRRSNAGDVYVFGGVRGNLVKILWHDRIGMSLCAWRLEKGRSGAWSRGPRGPIRFRAFLRRSVTLMHSSKAPQWPRRDRIMPDTAEGGLRRCRSNWVITGLNAIRVVAGAALAEKPPTTAITGLPTSSATKPANRSGVPSAERWTIATSTNPVSLRRCRNAAS
jgi:IS66 Orf2 like protein